MKLNASDDKVDGCRRLSTSCRQDEIAEVYLQEKQDDGDNEEIE